MEAGIAHLGPVSLGICQPLRNGMQNLPASQRKICEPQHLEPLVKEMWQKKGRKGDVKEIGEDGSLERAFDEEGGVETGTQRKSLPFLGRGLYIFFC